MFANKSDLPNAFSCSEITDKLGLHSLRNRKVRTSPSTTLSITSERIATINPAATENEYQLINEPLFRLKLGQVKLVVM